MNRVVYNGNNKNFVIPNKNLKVKPIVKLVFYIILLIIFTYLSFYFINNRYDMKTDKKVIEINESGGLFYQVYLKENNQYDDPFLNPGMEYVASIIDEVRIKYNYELHATDEIELTHTYKVTSTLLITNRNESGKTLKNEVKEIESGTFNVDDKDFNFLKDININYDEWELKVEEYKNELGVPVDSSVTINVEVITTNENDINKDDEDFKKFETINNLSIVIPLGEQTIGITMPSSAIANYSNLTDFDDIYTLNNFKIILAGFTVLISLFSLIRISSIVYFKYVKKDIYTKTIRKYLREYDRLIVSSKQPDLNEASFNNKIRVMSIEELIDAHDSTGSPIIYYEVVPHEKSYFIIIDGLTLYKLTISKAYLEEFGK